MKRRDFLKTCAAAPVALGTVPGRGPAPGPFRAGEGPKWAYDPKGLPTRPLGRTGVSVPLIGFGAGSRFCAVSDPGQSVAILSCALDNGLYYWDTAHSYADGNTVSEERLGLVLAERRDEVFLSTKTDARTYDGAMRHLEESLKRLRTDRLDVWKIHQVESLDDVAAIGADDGVLKALIKARDEKITRFIGFSGHRSAAAMTAMAERHDLDAMLIALNHYEGTEGDLERGAIPAAARKGMGIDVIKVIRPRETVKDVAPETLIRYALSLPHVTAAVIGTDGVAIVRKNAALARDFRPMDADEMKKVRAGLQPFFEDGCLPWARPGYRDGEKG
jgi:aryl-alcohol dehydrogenase-like predicted oxidoreductase